MSSPIVIMVHKIPQTHNGARMLLDIVSPGDRCSGRLLSSCGEVCGALRTIYARGRLQQPAPDVRCAEIMDFADKMINNITRYYDITVVYITWPDRVSHTSAVHWRRRSLLADGRVTVRFHL